MTYQELNEKAVIILGKGRYQKDFEYIFDELNVVKRYTDVHEMELDDIGGGIMTQSLSANMLRI